VRTVSPAGLHQLIAGHGGHVVVVNFWATWCPGCVEEFPNLVKLQKNLHGNGVDVVFVSGDDPGDRDGKVAPFLSDHGVNWTCYLMDDFGKFGPAFDHQLTGAFGLPRTYIYDRHGKLAKVIGNPSGYEVFRDAVRPLL
jgi:thiol-disulfide isomerase/thioredoxin